MTKSMTRGKQQVLFNYLPGKTFDFERGPISRVVAIRGFEHSELNQPMVVRKIAEQARAWSPDFRPALGNHILDDPSKFVLLDPQEVEAEMFPRVFWCTNLGCGRIFDWSGRGGTPPGSCEACKSGKLVQLRFIKVHRCGAIDALAPPSCPQCHGCDIALTARESERLSAFRWVCRKCGHAQGLFGGKCRHCEWPDRDTPRASDMDIEVHRAGRTYYPQNTVLLNIPRSEMEGLFANPNWECIVAAKYLRLPIARERPLHQFFSKTGAGASIDAADLDELLRSGLSPEKAMANLRALLEQKKANAAPSSDQICEEVSRSTGVHLSVWKDAGPELLEAITPFEGSATPARLSEAPDLAGSARLARRLGIEDLALAPDYTVVNATFGYSRVGYRPNDCWLNPFPPDDRYKGRLPIYVDRVQADALIISLDPSLVLTWLRANGVQVPAPSGESAQLAERAHFVRLFENASLHHTLSRDAPELRMVFGLLHTLSHHFIRQASLLCGLDRTSLSEYIIPRALMIAIYCNHRFGATIGALTALFEQALEQWLIGVRETRNCVYDPVCHDNEASCHACTHLAETSCRFFNLNLSRSFLFGGPDRELGLIRHGFFDMAATV